MKRELHPYGEFVPENARAMIIGSFPIGKFSDPQRRHEIGPHELDFFFGGEKNLLWKLLGSVFQCSVKTKEDVIRMLEEKGIGVGDVIRSCRRKKGGGSDKDLYDIEWNKGLLKVIQDKDIHSILFTSKKVEQWFHRLFPDAHGLHEISLISPSGQSLRGLGGQEDFKKWVADHPGENKWNFVLNDYREKLHQFL